VVLGVIVLIWWLAFGDSAPEEFNVSTQPKQKLLLTDEEMNKLTKAKLEELGREMGVELDKRKTKANMIADLKEKV
jgi:hypothetical protein